MRLLIIVIFLLLFSIKFFASAEEALREVTIVAIEGLVEVMKKDTKIWEQAKEGMVLLEGDKIRTEALSTVTLAFDKEEENIVEIDEDTEVVIDRLTRDRITKGEDTTLRMGVGGVLADIGEVKIDSEFEVRTPTAVAGIRGTRWKTEVSEDLRTRVVVFKGNVNVKGIDPQGRVMPEAVVVKEGEETQVKKYERPSPPEKIEEKPIGEKELKGASLFACGNNIEDIHEKISVSRSNLINDRFEITGRVDDGKNGADIKEVQISLDGGMSWRKAEGRMNWRYRFIPRDDETYTIDFRVLDLNGNPYQRYFEPVEITYSSVTDEQIIKQAFTEVKEAYNNKEIDRFMSYFSGDVSIVWDGERSSFDDFREDLIEEFSQAEDLSMDIRIGSIQVSRDTADTSGTIIIKGTITTGFTSLPYTSESSANFTFRKEEGKWKVVKMVAQSTTDTYAKGYMRQLAYAIQHAYETEDIDEYMSHFSRDYTDAEREDWDEEKTSTEQEFTLFENIKIDISNMSFNIKGPFATAQFTVKLTANESFIEGATFSETEDIFWKLRKEGQDWIVYEETFSTEKGESGVFTSKTAQSSTINDGEFIDFSEGTVGASGDVRYDGANQKLVASGSAGISGSLSRSLDKIHTVDESLLLTDNFASSQSVSSGNAYFIRTNESKSFAVISVTSASAGSVTISWKYSQ